MGGPLPTQWRGRLDSQASRASVDAGQACRLASSRMFGRRMMDDVRWCMHACDPRDGAERLRTHPAHVAPLTALPDSDVLACCHFITEATPHAALRSTLLLLCCYSPTYHPLTPTPLAPARHTITHTPPHLHSVLISTHNTLNDTPIDCHHQHHHRHSSSPPTSAYGSAPTGYIVANHRPILPLTQQFAHRPSQLNTARPRTPKHSPSATHGTPATPLHSPNITTNMPFRPEHSLLRVEVPVLHTIDTRSVENLFGMVSRPYPRSRTLPPPHAQIRA